MVRLAAAGFVFSTMFLAISSGPLLSLALQTGMMLWDRILAFLRSRWILAIVFAGVGFAVLQASVKGGLFAYLVENLVFSTGAGENRLDIYRYGTGEVLQNPWFGIGLGDWARPFWREHATIDNFWLMTAMRHGIPGFLLLMIGLLVSLVRIAHRPGARRGRGPLPLGLPDRALRPAAHPQHRAHLGAVNVFVMAYFGAGAWFYARAAAPAPPPVRGGPWSARLPRERRRPRGAGPGVRGRERHGSRQGDRGPAGAAGSDCATAARGL